MRLAIQDAVAIGNDPIESVEVNNLQHHELLDGTMLYVGSAEVEFGGHSYTLGVSFTVSSEGAVL